MRYLIALIACLTVASACGGAGLGKDVRKDVTSTMQSAEGDLASCYEAALKRDPEAKARMRLDLKVAAKSGNFQPSMASNTSSDSEFETCVLTTVSALKLSKPQGANLTTVYPLKFLPN